MKKEIGKWFLDIAKYIATAVLLAQIFGGVADTTFLVLYAIISIVVIFAIGTYFIHTYDIESERKNKKKGNKNEWSSCDSNIIKCYGYWKFNLFPFLR